MPTVSQVRLAAFGQTFPAELAEDFLKAIADRSLVGRFGHHQRLVHQAAEDVENVFGAHRLAAGDRLGGLKRPATGEDRQMFEQALLWFRKQAIAPVERASKRLVAERR